MSYLPSQEPKNYLSPSPPSAYTAEDDGVTKVYGDYDEYKSTAASHADVLHEYFKHLNHNYQQQQVVFDNFDIHVKQQCQCSTIFGDIWCSGFVRTFRYNNNS